MPTELRALEIAKRGELGDLQLSTSTFRYEVKRGNIRVGLEPSCVAVFRDELTNPGSTSAFGYWRG